jgi:hypothetical protein
MDPTQLKRLRFRLTPCAGLLFTLCKMAPISILTAILIATMSSPAHYDLDHSLEHCPADSIQDITLGAVLLAVPRLYD